MSADELKSMPKGSFLVMKTGTHPMKAKLKLFFKWGIQFGQPLQMPDQGSRPVYYASKNDLERAILQACPIVQTARPAEKPEEQEPESQPVPQTNLRTGN